MATTTTNLGLTKPSGTDKIRIAQINGNMDILDDKIGAVGNTSLQAQVTSANQAIAKLDSNANETTDILASAVSCTKTMFFKTSGSSSYVGTLPSNDYKVSTFIVTIRGGGRFVTAINSVGAVATNYYNGSSWSGWQELALKSDIQNVPKVQFGEITATTTANANISLDLRMDTYDVLSISVITPEVKMAIPCMYSSYNNGIWGAHIVSAYNDMAPVTNTSVTVKYAYVERS